MTQTVIESLVEFHLDNWEEASNDMGAFRQEGGDGKYPAEMTNRHHLHASAAMWLKAVEGFLRAHADGGNQAARGLLQARIRESVDAAEDHQDS